MPKTYQIVFDKKAAKFFSSQPKEQQKRLAVSISNLPKGDTKQLRGEYTSKENKSRGLMTTLPLIMVLAIMAFVIYSQRFFPIQSLIVGIG